MKSFLHNLRAIQKFLDGRGVYQYFKTEIHWLLATSVLLSVTEFSFIVIFPLFLSFQMSGAPESGRTQSIYTFLNGHGIHPGLGLVAALMLTLAARTLLVSGIKYYQNKLIANWKAGIESLIFKKALYDNTTEYSPTERSDILNLITKESEIMAYDFATLLFGGLGEAVILILGAIVLFYLSPAFGVLCSVLGLASLLIFIKVNRRISGSTEKRAFESRKRANYLANQSLSCVSEVRIYGLETKLSRDYFDTTLFSAHAMGIAKTSGLTSPLIFEFVVYTVVCIAASSHSSVQELRSSTLFLWIGFGAFRMMPSINRLLVSLSALRFSFPSVVALDSALKKGSPIPRVDETKNRSILSEEEAPASPNEPPLAIRAQNISFRYPNQESSIVKNLSFSLEAGSVVGIVGSSGTGKSTFSKLLLGLLQPVEGRVEFWLGDRKISNPFPHVASVSSQSLVFGQTVEENVALGSQATPDPSRICKALLDGGFTFNLSSPEECNTLLKREISSLSSGQFQRVMIARALYSGRKLLVLDEATSMLDNETQALVTDTIKNLKGAYTILIIAHRQEALISCDRIFQLLPGGNLEEIKSLHFRTS
jgi:ABC-type multidrug transport system fused ATPase/permease subunit